MRFRRRRPRAAAWTIAPWEVGQDVDDLAQLEAWRQAGHGVGELSEALEPAVCKRVAETEYVCMAEIRAGDNHPAYRVEMAISCPPDGEPVVTDAHMRRA